MSWLAFRRLGHQIWCRLNRVQLDRDFEAELRTHLRELTADKRAAGMAPDNARKVAKLELGDLDLLRAQHRAAREGATWRDACGSLNSELPMDSTKKTLLRAECALGLAGGLAIIIVAKLTTNGHLQTLPLLAMMAFGPVILRRRGLGWELRDIYPAYLLVSSVTISCVALYAALQSPGAPSAPAYVYVALVLVQSIVGSWVFAGLVRMLHLTSAAARRPSPDPRTAV